MSTHTHSKIECEVERLLFSAKLRRQINKDEEIVCERKVIGTEKTMVQLFYYENRGKCCRKLWKHDGNKLKVSKVCH